MIRYLPKLPIVACCHTISAKTQAFRSIKDFPNIFAFVLKLYNYKALLVHSKIIFLLLQFVPEEQAFLDI